MCIPMRINNNSVNFWCKIQQNAHFYAHLLLAEMKRLSLIAAVPNDPMNKQEKLEELRTYLKQTTIAWQGTPIAKFNKFILDKGLPFTEAILAKETEETKIWVKQRRPKLKECFYNAQMFLMMCDKGDYYEGYCYESLLPVHHAWIVIDGKVVDFTLEARDRSLARQKIKTNSKDAIYLGVVVPKKTIMTHIVKTGISEPVAYQHYLDPNVRYV